MSSSLGWTCQHCTYQHTVPGTRCVMCQQLRVSKEQMRDFIAGKTLPKKKASQDDNKTETTNNNVKENRPPPPQPPVKSAPVTAAIRNPYAKKTTSATAPTKPPPPSNNGMQQQSSLFNPSSGMTASAASRNSTVTPIVRQQQQWAPPAYIVNGGNSSLPPQRAASSQSWPMTNRPASAAATMPQAQARGPPAKPKPAPNTAAQSKKNPFTLSVRPAPMQYVPGPVPLCPETAVDWIYPVHESYPIRTYQLEMSKTAVLYNTLVSLPTGLGKTLIASVVLYNFYRWFPTGKVVFLAPTLPLVNQQVKACYDIMGIPAEDTALLTGKVNAKDREGLWKERRVFFCTPQTVQRDIESERCPANQVVCVVLDEAHKASGAYAYVKVVQYLEQAGAKFRILGLSATPGTNIKSIQEVVTALRIHKIEARLEDDPNVKQYVHERHNEIILVKSISAMNTIERLLDHVIAPLLDRIRAGNGLTNVRGNATLTPWNIIQGMNDYHNRTNGDHSMDSHFYAANALVQIRAETRRTGMGVVRNKMIQLQNNPKSGLMGSIVKGGEFQAVMDAVLAASCDPDNVNERAEDRKLNNPKLAKLDEILVEHFERARACGNSSRAIVFTQWRDSVSEIVGVLSSSQPLLRARHFVGQGKSSGGANKEKVDQSCASLKGMKQKEQQAVIREFREGVYNVLVCTCIGEEGLDIGEVDLIVNYDSLRSPIRMIQRVGRTGRKRDGRVVCLVSEGAEERTMHQSKQAEKTLGRALKKPESFKVIRSSPMFPQEPELKQVDMSVAAKAFHMSQVGGGNGFAGKSKRDPNDTGKVRAELGMDWRLNAAQERRREEMFGDISFSTCTELQSSPNGQISHALRKRFLRARTRSISTYDSRRKLTKASFGVARNILLKVEREHGKDVDRRALFNSGGPTRSRRESGALQQLFPLERSSETDSLGRGLLKMSLSAVESSSSLQEEERCQSSSAPTGPAATSEQQQNGSPKRQESTEPLRDTNMTLEPAGFVITSAQQQNQSPKRQESTAPLRDSNLTVEPAGPVVSSAQQQNEPKRQESTALPFPGTNLTVETRPKNPYLSQTNEKRASRAENMSEIQEEVVPAPSNVAQPVTSTGDEPVECLDEGTEPPMECDQFHLPPPSESSSSEDSSSSDDESIEEEKEDADQAEVSSNTDSHVPVGAHERPDSLVPAPLIDSTTAATDALRLPTQESSSSDDESSDESSSDEEQAVHAASSKESLRPPSEINVDCALVDNRNSENFLFKSKSGTEMDIGTSQIFSDTPEGDDYNDVAQNYRKSSLSLGSQSHVTATPLVGLRTSSDSGAELTDTPVAATPLAAPCAPSDSGADLVDTPQCGDAGRMLPPPSRTMSSHDSQRSASKDDAEEVVCSVCFDGSSPENNPIVLCDGPNNDLSCSLAVHKLCYSISGSLEGLDHWHCDVCAHQQRQRQSKKRPAIQCFVCHKEDGPIKECPDSAASQFWFHPQCRHVVVKPDSFCQYCASEGATCCAVEGCMEYAHPHCGIKLKKPWIVVAYASSDPSSSVDLSSDDVIGCNIYCPGHREQVVCQALANVGVTISPSTASPRFVIVPSKFRDQNSGAATTAGVARKRLRKKSSPDGLAAASSTKESIESVDQRELKRQRVRERMKERSAGMQRCRFLDLEVEDSDEDGDLGEEDEARRIEEEEAFYKDFINDSSQLGAPTQPDALDRLGLSENAPTPGLDETGAIHRRVDAMREKANQFATPVFNRRMRKHGRGRENDTHLDTSQQWDEPTPASEPSSSKGLGNMHFIRSVLEHHRNGGEADDIEDMYHTVAQDASPLEEERPVPRRNPAGPIVMPCASDESDSDDDSDDDDDKKPAASDATRSGGPSRASTSAPHQGSRVAAAANPNGFVTAQQLARMEAKRLEALRKRQQHQAQSNGNH